MRLTNHIIASQYSRSLFTIQQQPRLLLKAAILHNAAVAVAEMVLWHFHPSLSPPLGQVLHHLRSTVAVAVVVVAVVAVVVVAVVAVVVVVVDAAVIVAAVVVVVSDVLPCQRSVERGS